MTHITLTTDSQITAYLHRARMQILEILSGQPKTISQVAIQMQVHPANLSRHMRQLETAGLIKLVEKRDTGKNLEKYYAAIAQSFDVAPTSHTEPLHKAALAMLRSDLSAAIAHLPDNDPGETLALLAHAAIAPKDIENFSAELKTLLKKFQDTDKPSGTPYHLNLSLYPGDLQSPPTQSIKLEQE